MSILAALDNMNVAEPDEIRDQLVSIFVRVSSTLHRCEQDFTHEQVEKLASLIGEFYSEEEFVTGEDAENLFYDVYQKTWKKKMNTAEDASDFYGDIDWRKLRLPKKIIVRLSAACAAQDAVNTKAWYKYAQDHLGE